MQPGAGSYDQVLKALAQSERGSYGDLSYMPVFRASALFYVLVDAAVTTKVAFLNYWREKNGNAHVGVLLTVRDTIGKPVARRHVRLAEMTYEFDVRELVGGITVFRGSIEVEAFSADDLKFQFPGLSVFYQSEHGVSYVHTNQRVYNDAEDRRRSESLNPWQTGFEIDAGRFDPFVFIVNGPQAVEENAMARLVFLDAEGREMKKDYALGVLPPYAAVDLRLAQIEGVAEFLGGRPGMCKIDLPMQNVHLRLGVGNSLKDQSWLSITHSYFDATGHQDFFETTSLPAGAYPAFIPFNLPSELDVTLVLYPIYARSVLDLRLQGFDARGALKYSISLGSYASPDDGIRRFDVRELLAEAGFHWTEGLQVLQIAAADGRIPSRITYGLNFSAKGRLGTNISASAYLAKSWGTGKRSWRWGPVVALPGARNIIMLSGFGKTAGDSTVREGAVTLHDCGGPVASCPFVLAGNSAVNIEAEHLMASVGYVPRPGSILWYVVESQHASLDVNQVCVSAEGFVGGDHCF